MVRTAESGARAHRSRPVPVLPSALIAAAACAAAPGGVLGGSAARLLAPNLRGCVSSRTLAAMEARGLTVHRLGRVSDGYRRRVDRLARETRHRELARIAGRFAGRLPWWRVPPVRAYRWDPAPRSWLEQVTAQAADHNHAVRVRLGLEWATAPGGAWYPEAGSALEARSQDGDR